MIRSDYYTRTINANHEKRGTLLHQTIRNTIDQKPKADAKATAFFHGHNACTAGVGVSIVGEAGADLDLDECALLPSPAVPGIFLLWLNTTIASFSDKEVIE